MLESINITYPHTGKSFCVTPYAFYKPLILLCGEHANARQTVLGGLKTTNPSCSVTASRTQMYQNIYGLSIKLVSDDKQQTDVQPTPARQIGFCRISLLKSGTAEENCSNW